MAGIGFELKKILKKEGIGSIIRVISYSTFSVIGPTVLVIATIIALYIMLGLMSVSYTVMELLSSTILYTFIFSLIATAPFNGVISRYIANKIFEEEYGDILPSYYVGLLLCVVLGAIMGIPIIVRLLTIGNVKPLFVLMSYGLFITLIINFFSMVYLSSTKDYKIMALFHVIGMAITFLIAFLLRELNFDIIEAILYGLVAGFFVIDVLEFAYIKKYLKSNSKNYTELLKYFVEYKNILLCNLFYFLGFYVHIFIFWTHPDHIIVAKTYVSMQSYDMATCLAMFTSISAMVIFTVMAETKFHTKYQDYNNSVIGNTLEYIKNKKRRMFRLLIQQMRYLVSIQAIITALIYLIVKTVLPNLGFGGNIMDIYPLLVVAFFIIFMMYANIIFMYYFDDTKGALTTSIIFFVSVLIGSVFSVKLVEELFGLGVTIGACIAWTYSFFRVKYMEKHFDRHIFCRNSVVTKRVQKTPSSRVYYKGNYLVGEVSSNYKKKKRLKH